MGYAITNAMYHHYCWYSTCFIAQCVYAVLLRVCFQICHKVFQQDRLTTCGTYLLNLCGRFEKVFFSLYNAEKNDIFNNKYEIIRIYV